MFGPRAIFQPWRRQELNPDPVCCSTAQPGPFLLSEPRNTFRQSARSWRRKYRLKIGSTCFTQKTIPQMTFSQKTIPKMTFPKKGFTPKRIFPQNTFGLCLNLNLT
jgi:hypothetical protein